MSLLTDASLLLTPNAYKEGKLYSVIPSNGNGDFTATRATTATRVNSAGLVDLVPYNLVRYSDMFADAVWTKTRTSITANSETAPDGTLTADTLTANGASGSHSLLQTTTLPLSPNITYTTSIYAKKNTNNFIQLVGSGPYVSGDVWANFDLNNGVVGSVGALTTASIQNVGNGWYRCNMTATAVAFDNINAFASCLISSSTSPRFESNTLSTSVFVWGAQLVEGTSARDYLRTETRLNIPRVDYSLGGCPNILLEPQRTNLALQSSSFDSATWGKTAITASANTTISPSGIQDADTLAGDGTLSVKALVQNGTATLTSGVTYTTSIYAKKNTNNFIQIVGSTAPYVTANVFANFDLNSGVVGSVGASVTATITNVGNGWYRCTMTAAAAATSNTNTFIVQLVSSSTAVRGEINTLSTSVFLWGAQLEAGAYSTSFIPTTTASVTRNADIITRNNIFTNGFITAAGGTWFVELRNTIARTRDTFAQSLFIGGLSTGVNTDGFSFTQAGGSSRSIIRKYVAGIETILFTLTADNAKIAIKWNGSTMDIFQNGVKVVSSSAFTATNMQWLVGNGNDVPKFINEMALFPTPLTDAQCIALTA